MKHRVALPEGVTLAPFKPTAFVNAPMDMLIYVERDCSYLTVEVEGSNITLLYDTRVTPRQLVGVQIHGISSRVDGTTLQIVPEP